MHAKVPQQGRVVQAAHSARVKDLLHPTNSLPPLLCTLQVSQWDRPRFPPPKRPGRCDESVLPRASRPDHCPTPVLLPVTSEPHRIVAGRPRLGGQGRDKPSKACVCRAAKLCEPEGGRGTRGGDARRRRHVEEGRESRGGGGQVTVVPTVAGGSPRRRPILGQGLGQL